MYIRHLPFTVERVGSSLVVGELLDVLGFMVAHTEGVAA